jgi:hypothetical protein
MEAAQRLATVFVIFVTIYLACRCARSPSIELIVLTIDSFLASLYGIKEWLHL